MIRRPSLPGVLKLEVAQEDWSRAPREPVGFAIARTPATNSLCRLGELFTVSKARLGAGRPRSDEPVDFIGLDNVVAHRDALTGSLLTRLSALSGELRRVIDGQVLLSRLRPELNKVVHVSRAADSLPCYCTPELLVLEACPELILAPVLRDLLASAWVNGVIVPRLKATARLRITVEELMQLQVPLPPLAAQRVYVRERAARAMQRARLQQQLLDLESSEQQDLARLFGRDLPEA